MNDAWDRSQIPLSQMHPAPGADGEEPSQSIEVEQLLGPLSARLALYATATSPGTSPAVRFQVRTPSRPAVRTGGSAAGQSGRDTPSRTSRTEAAVAWLSLRDWVAQASARQLNVEEAVGELLERIDSLQPVLNAFITVATRDDLRGAAQPLAGRLAGVPVVLKDIIDTANVRTTCGSEIYRSRVPDRDAACWSRLRQEGALLLGKANTHEFAAGVTSVNDFYGAVRNPWDPLRSPGGSSGGSAAAVAAGLAPASLGSDTGGSVRIPASCCGVVGFKPTFGRVPVDGVHPLAWSLDTVGPIARTVADTAVLVDVLSSSGECEPAAEAGRTSSLQSVTVAVHRPWVEALDEGMTTCFWEAVQALKHRGARLVDVSDLPDLDLLLTANRVIAYAEGSAAHAHLFEHRHRYGAQIRARMETGRHISAEQYLLAQRLRSKWCEQLERVWAQADVLITPTLPCPPPEISASTAIVAGGRVPLGSALVWFTGPFNLAGTPAISLPCGLPDGLPSGLQIVAPPYNDASVAFVAAACEDELPPFPHPPLATTTGSRHGALENPSGP